MTASGFFASFVGNAAARGLRHVREAPADPSSVPAQPAAHHFPEQPPHHEPVITDDVRRERASCETERQGERSVEHTATKTPDGQGRQRGKRSLRIREHAGRAHPGSRRRRNRSRRRGCAGRNRAGQTRLHGRGHGRVHDRYGHRVLRQLLLFHCGGQLLRRHLLHRRREIRPGAGHAARVRHVLGELSGPPVRQPSVRALRRPPRPQENPGGSPVVDGNRNVLRRIAARLRRARAPVRAAAVRLPRLPGLRSCGRVVGCRARGDGERARGQARAVRQLPEPGRPDRIFLRVRREPAA